LLPRRQAVKGKRHSAPHSWPRRKLRCRRFMRVRSWYCPCSTCIPCTRRNTSG